MLQDRPIDDLAHLIKADSSSVVLFGAGSVGKLALYALKKKGIDVDCFCDNSKEKQGNLYCGVRVISPEELSGLNPKAHVFICNNYIASVSELLARMNFTNIHACASFLEDTDFSAADLEGKEEADLRFKHKPLEIERLLWAYKTALKTELTSLNIRYIDIVVTERCSMKCQDCSNLMQYYTDPENSDLDLLFKSIDKLMACINSVHECRVMGGEPFVNKDIYKVIDKLVACPKVENVLIYTNATVPLKEEHLPSLKNRKVKFDITNYGNLSRNHGRLIDVLKTNNVEYVTHLATTWTDSGRIEYRERTEEEHIDVFMNCCVNDVWTLLNGRLYVCPFSANAHNLNAIPMSREDVIDLSDESQEMTTLKSKIEAFYTRKERRRYLTACEYCGGRDYRTPEIPAGIQTKHPLSLPSFSATQKLDPPV